MNDESKDDGSPWVSLPEARRLAAKPSLSFVEAMVASHSICESADSTLNDLFACAGIKYRSAAWRPTLLLHERTGIPERRDERGYIVIDLEFWREYFARLPQDSPMDKSS